MVCLLVTRCEASKNQDVLVRDLVEAAALQADPVRVLFYPEVERLPMLPSLNVILLDEVRALASIEPSHDVQSLAVKSDSCMEVAARIEASHLRPSVTADIVHFALVH